MAPTDFSNLRCRLELLEDRDHATTNDCEPLFATWHLFGTPSLWSISTSSTFTGMRDTKEVTIPETRVLVSADCFGRHCGRLFLGL